MIGKRWFSLAACTLCVLLPYKAARSDEESLSPDQILQIRKSVVLLSCSGSAKGPKRATGFVIKPPGHRSPIIITAAHALEGGPVVDATCLDCGDTPCYLVDFSDELDLVALKPIHDIPVPPLELAEADLSDRDIDKPLWLFSWRQGYLRPLADRGYYKDALPARQLENIAPLPSNGLKVPRNDTLLLLHSCDSVKGMSGGPLVDHRGRVVGIHNSREGLKGEGNKFAVSVRHLRKPMNRQAAQLAPGTQILDLDATVDKTFNKALLAFHLPLLPASEHQASDKLLLSTDEGNIDARFLRHGYASRDAATVIRENIIEPETFEAEFGRARLQRLLDTTPFIRVSNPTFGFKLLIPRGCTITSKATDDPRGVALRVTFSDPDLSPPYNSFTVRAFLVPGRFDAAAQRALQTKLRPEGYRFLGTNSNDPKAQEKFRRVFVANHIAGLWNAAFPLEILRLRVRPPGDGSIMQLNPLTNEVFAVTDLNEQLPFTPWFREHLVAESSPLCYAVHGCVLDEIVVAVDYAFEQKDFNAYSAHAEPSLGYLMKVLMRGSLSFY